MFFDFASDKTNVIAEGLRVTEVGGTVLAVGGGNSGFLTLARALVVGSRVDGGGYSAASPATHAPCFEVAAGATLSVNTGVQHVLGSAGKAGPTFSGPGSVLKPAVVSKPQF